MGPTHVSGKDRPLFSYFKKIRHKKPSLLVAAVLALSGCSTFIDRSPDINQASSLALPPAPMPSYRVGESFTFSDGQTETVMAVRGDAITWRTNSGVVRVGARNFFIPFKSWQNRQRRSEAATTAPPNMLWPLKTGNKGYFELWQAIEDNDGSNRREYDQKWVCVVKGTEKVTVTAGSFDAYKVSCYRYDAISGFWQQTRAYYYAPSLGHYVLREDTYTSRPSRVRELVSAGFNSTALPQPEQTSLIATLQRTLDATPDGTGVGWRSSNGKISATLTPLRSYTGDKGAFCREYTSAYSYSGRNKTNVRRVCRDEKGVWRREPPPPPPPPY